MNKNSGTSPCGRNSHTMNYSKIQNSIILFGGANSNGPLNDIYAYSIGIDIYWMYYKSNSNEVR